MYLVRYPTSKMFFHHLHPLTKKFNLLYLNIIIQIIVCVPTVAVEVMIANKQKTKYLCMTANVRYAYLSFFINTRRLSFHPPSDNVEWSLHHISTWKKKSFKTGFFLHCLFLYTKCKMTGHKYQESTSKFFCTENNKHSLPKRWYCSGILVNWNLTCVRVQRNLLLKNTK